MYNGSGPGRLIYIPAMPIAYMEYDELRIGEAELPGFPCEFCYGTISKTVAFNKECLRVLEVEYPENSDTPENVKKLRLTFSLKHRLGRVICTPCRERYELHAKLDAILGDSDALAAKSLGRLIECYYLSIAPKTGAEG